MTATSTIAELVRRRAEDDNIALYEGDRQWTYREFVDLCAERAQFLLAQRTTGPFHVGILMDNRVEFPIWIGACALA
ncbi:AMP-binding protein, partial [Rhodococcus sp. NPDC058514]